MGSTDFILKGSMIVFMKNNIIIRKIMVANGRESFTKITRKRRKSGGFLYNIDPEQHHKTKIKLFEKATIPAPSLK